MCGIVGYNIAGKNYLLEKAISAIRHRGPDGEGCMVLAGGKIALGHTRLAIQDLSIAGAQPMTDENKDLAISYNGEIYNVDHLRSKLKRAGFSFFGRSDTEVLLKYYSFCKTRKISYKQMLEGINGIFAFAIWDKKIERLFLARDRFGVKPLYYLAEKNNFIFSSELKAIKTLVSDLGPIDLIALKRYLSFQWCPGNNTLSSKVKKINPGTFMVVYKTNILENSKWSTSSNFKRDKRSIKFSESIRDTQYFLKQAVNRQLLSDVPIGAFLSGGLDSSSIVALARQEKSEIPCFTIKACSKTGSNSNDDYDYAKLVAKHLKVDLSTVEMDASQIVNDLEKMIWHLDEPLADPASLNVLYISRRAREKGINVLLSGVGGDDVFSGYRRHLALRMDSILEKFPSFILSNIEKGSAYLDKRFSLFRKISKFADGLNKKNEERLVNFFYWINPNNSRKLYSSEILDEIDKSDAAKPFFDELFSLPPDASNLDKMLELERRFFLGDHNLIYTDKMSMANGVETRVPFLDNDLVDFASVLPDRFKLSALNGKIILKKAMEEFLPKSVVYRAKQGFSLPLRKWINDDLSEMVGDFLSKDSLKKRGLFDPQEVENLIRDNRKGFIDGGYTIFSLLCIEIWCKQFIDAS